MDKDLFETEITTSLEVLRRGGVLLYPTDTVWGLGCDATNREAVARIYTLKQRSDAKSLIILIAEERDLLHWVAAPDPEVFDFWEAQERPTTIIFPQALGLPDNLVAADGSIGIRLVKDPFCRHLIKRLRAPLVSTSANISGRPTPASFRELDEALLRGADHVVRWRQDEEGAVPPSRIIRWKGDGQYDVLRD
jgi:L-threonylcarbamoyladenylate synthase